MGYWEQEEKGRVNGAADIPPTVNIYRPAGNESLSGIINLYGTASDPDGEVVRVEVSVDGGGWMIAQGTTVWSI